MVSSLADVFEPMFDQEKKEVKFHLPIKIQNL